MIMFFSLLIRVIWLSISFLLSTFAAATFITFILFLDGDVSWLTQDIFAAGGAIAFATVVWLQITSQSFVPTLLIFAGLEAGRYVGLVTNLLAGGACALIVMMMGAPLEISVSDTETMGTYDPEKLWLVALSAGFIAGFTHWLLAGHRAGRWLGNPAKINAPQSSEF